MVSGFLFYSRRLLFKTVFSFVRGFYSKHFGALWFCILLFFSGVEQRTGVVQKRKHQKKTPEHKTTESLSSGSIQEKLF